MNNATPPVAQRTFRHPETGERVQLVARRVPGPGRQLWWSVDLLRADGTCPLAGEMAISWRPTRADARRLCAERERALRTAGYVWDQAE